MIRFHVPNTASNVDRANAVIRDVSLITGNREAEGHGLTIDATTLNQVLLSAKKAGQIPVKLNHGSGIENVCGYLDNFRLEGHKVLGDWHLLKNHSETDLLMERAERMPSCWGMSVAFKGTGQDIGGGKKAARCEELKSVDCVTAPAANDSLFSAVDPRSRNSLGMFAPASAGGADPQSMASAYGGVAERKQSRLARIAAALRKNQPVMPATAPELASIENLIRLESRMDSILNLAQKDKGTLRKMVDAGLVTGGIVSGTLIGSKLGIRAAQKLTYRTARQGEDLAGRVIGVASKRPGIVHVGVADARGNVLHVAPGHGLKSESRRAFIGDNEILVERGNARVDPRDIKKNSAGIGDWSPTANCEHTAQILTGRKPKSAQLRGIVAGAGAGAVGGGIATDRATKRFSVPGAFGSKIWQALNGMDKGLITKSGFAPGKNIGRDALGKLDGMNSGIARRFAGQPVTFAAIPSSYDAATARADANATATAAAKEQEKKRKALADKFIKSQQAKATAKAQADDLAGFYRDNTFSTPDQQRKPMNPYLKAGLSAGVSGAAVGGIFPLLKIGGKLSTAAKTAAMLGGASAGIVGAGSWLGGKIIGQPKEGESLPFTKRATIGGAIAGTALGGLGVLASKKIPFVRKGLEDLAKEWRPAKWISQAGPVKAVAGGTVAGGIAGAYQGMDEGQQVDNINAVQKERARKARRFASAERLQEFAQQFVSDEGGIPLTGKIAKDRFIKKLRDEDLNRRDANLLRTGLAGAAAGALLGGKAGLLKRAAIGAGAGALGVIGTRAVTSQTRDVYGERSRGAKQAEKFLPIGAAATLAGLGIKKKITGKFFSEIQSAASEAIQLSSKIKKFNL